jgi:hypothetical protein
MPNCSYCGKPAGLLRRYHAECRAQFDRAIGTIPLFFEKLLESDLPADRFKQLLREVAERFHIEPKKLRSITIDGINAMVQAALRQRLVTPDEEDRILEIAEAVGLTLSDMPDLEEKLVKVRVLRDLGDGRTPDRIEVVGPMPIDLEPGETIIWIVNGAHSYRQPREPAPPRAPSRPQHDMPDYFSQASLGQQPAPTDGLISRGDSDLMITDRNLFVVLSERHLKIPLTKVEAFHAYSNGFQIVLARKESRDFIVTVADSWFAANLIVKLIRLSSNAGPQLEGAWKTS